MPLTLTNKQARRLILDRTRLSTPIGGPCVPEGLRALKRDLGFVQLDSIQTVARAHHHILWSRTPAYREPHLATLLETRAIFEHWTHDAAAIPIEFYPHWHHQFARFKKSIDASDRWKKRLGDPAVLKAVRKRIERDGPLMVRDFEKSEKRAGSWWAWGPEKAALEYLWFSGVLTTTGRRGFQKIYDLSDRVIPKDLRTQKSSKADHLDWICREALYRLGTASASDIQGFWNMVSLDAVKGWIADNSRTLIDVEIVPADKGRPIQGVALRALEEEIDTLPTPSSRLRILSPFDPLIRDRTRLERVFGFTYRIEIFVPKAKREFGYYVYPILEGDTFVGRIDVTADRKAGDLIVQNIWPEPGTRFGKGRLTKLHSELDRMRRFAGVETVTWTCPKPG